MSPNNTNSTGELRGRDGRLPDDADAQLDRFVRNRYFTGKLMTARDMQTQADYHSDRLETLAQHVAGQGAVCGLGTTVDQEAEGEPLEVSVEPGYALDCCGRAVLLDTTGHETVPPEDLPDPDETTEEGELPPGLAVYVRLEECYTEKVPVNGSEDACREDCTFNRVVEDFAIVTEHDDPDVKRVRRLTFPDRADLDTYDPAAGPDPDDPGLQIPARSYNDDPQRDGFQHRLCATEGDPRIFLGYYARDGSDWWLVEDAAPRHYVYPNDMLYAGIVRHAADFENPHEVLVGVDEYVRDKALKYTIEAYYETAERYAVVDNEFAEEATERAREIILGARDALDAGYFRSEAAFVITGIYLSALGWDLRGTLREARDEDAEVVSERSLADYSAVFERLRDPLPESHMEVVHDRDEASELWERLLDGETPAEVLGDLEGEADATELAVILDLIAEAASWLEHGEEPAQILLPGADEEMDARIVGTAIDQRGGETEGIDELRRELDRLRGRVEQLENRLEEPQAARFERRQMTVERGGVAEIDVTFGEADSLGFVFGSEEMNFVYRAGLTAGEDETVTLLFDTGRVEEDEDILAVDGDADVHPVEDQRETRDRQLDVGQYDLQLLVPDLDGWVISRAALRIQRE